MLENTPQSTSLTAADGGGPLCFDYRQKEGSLWFVLTVGSLVQRELLSEAKLRDCYRLKNSTK